MEIPFYFDYACPWAYIGSCRVEDYFKGLGVEIDFRPVYLKKLKEPQAGTTPKFGERKKRHSASDLTHWADLCGADFSDTPLEKPPGTGLLLASALVAKDEGRFRDFHYPAYRARWAEARDVSDAAVVHALLRGAGLDADAAFERARSDEIRGRLDADTEEAIARGVFGVPTVFVGDEMFWGNDRFELVRHYLEKS